MTVIKAVATLALAVALLLGYNREQGDTPNTPEPTLHEEAQAAAPVLAIDSALSFLPAGPWVTYEPPRKLRPRLRAHAALVVDAGAGATLYGRRADEVRPIASLVKLLTALVFLESGGSLDQEIEITPEDARNAGKSILWKGHRFKARDVLYTALLSSENRAARALARSTPYSPEQFMARMQERAEAIGCTTVRVVEPTGLSELNVASAHDVARILAAALDNPTIRSICRTYRYQFKALNSRKQYRITNSNRMLPSRYKVRGGKTGYIVEAGWCLACMFETPGGPVITVVMGSRSNSSRFAETRRLMEWALKYRPRSHTFALAS